ncbi:MAG TPA: amidohydrolase family protein [Nitrospiria bacterium]|nr:amidohydrolase family protein [Nitrospiria bacterium]
MPPIIDIHTHVFSLDPARSGCTLSPKSEKRALTYYLRWRNGIGLSEELAAAEEKFQAKWLQVIEETEQVDRIVILAHDAVYEKGGKLSEEKTHFYVPNDYVLALSKKHPKLLAGASVHPFRRDALEEIDRVMEQGAVLVKWLPNTQGFDPMDRDHIPFFRKLADRRVALLCHTGPEFALKSLDQSLGHPDRLRLALETGVTVIAAHGGGWGLLPQLGFKKFTMMLLDYPNFYTDTSALTLPPRSRYLIKLLDRPELHAKLVHGSDYPLPVSPWPFFGRIPLKEARRLSKIRSPIDRDLLIKKALGFPDAVFENAAVLIGEERLRRRNPGTDEKKSVGPAQAGPTEIGDRREANT